MTRSSKLFGSWRSAVMMLAALAITGSLLNSVSAQPQPSAPTGRSLSSITGPAAQRNAFRRLKYFHDQRAYPNTRIPAGAYQKARQDYEQKWGAKSAQAVPPAFALNSWTPIGPDHIANGLPYQASGRLNSIAIHPTNVNIIYAGTATGGVWKTTDGGASWTPLTDSQCSTAMGSVAVDPSNPNIVYAGTGEQNFSIDSYYGCGVLKSTDGGTSWSQLGASVFDTPSGGASIAKIAIHPSTTSTLLVASDFGLYRSTDSGASFSLVRSGTATDVVIDPSSPSTMYAAIGNVFGGASNGVYKSGDTGATWSLLAGGFPTTNVGRINLAIAASSPSTVYAAIQNSNTLSLLAYSKPPMEARPGRDFRRRGHLAIPSAGTTWASPSIRRMRTPSISAGSRSTNRPMAAERS